MQKKSNEVKRLSCGHTVSADNHLHDPSSLIRDSVDMSNMLRSSVPRKTYSETDSGCWFESELHEKKSSVTSLFSTEDQEVTTRLFTSLRR